MTSPVRYCIDITFPDGHRERLPGADGAQTFDSEDYAESVADSMAALTTGNMYIVLPWDGTDEPAKEIEG